VVALDLGEDSEAVLSADGRRTIDVPGGSRVEVRQDPRPVRFARLASAPFTDRLVAKFALPVEGWRGRRPEAG
jgi:NAD+ kinase